MVERPETEAFINGLAAYYAWARAKQFDCHFVCLSSREVTFKSSDTYIVSSLANFRVFS